MQQQINKELLKQRFGNGLSTYSQNAIIQHDMAITLSNLITKFNNKTELNIFEAGVGAGLLTEQLFDKLKIDKYTGNDLVADCGEIIKKISHLKSHQSLFLEGDIEELNYGNNYDIITGNAVFQWLSQPHKFWQEAANRLNQNGLIAITTFGVQNFMEISKLTQISLRYPSLKELHNIFSPNYKILELYTETKQLYFESGRDVLRHIRQTGTGGIRQEKWSREKLLDFEKRYHLEFQNQHKMVTLTYQPIYLIAQKR